MKVLRTKQQERSERKKRKLAALANLVNLNDKDRLAQEIKLAKMAKELSERESSPDADDGFIKVTHKKKQKSTTKRKEKESTPKQETPKRKKRNSHNQDEECTTNKRMRVDAIKHNDEAELDDDSSSIRSVTTSPLPLANDNNQLSTLPIALSKEQYDEMKAQLRERKRELANVPVFHLRECGQHASIALPHEQRTPIFLTDIQHLLMSSLLGSRTPCVPDRWCHLEKAKRLSHSVVLVLEGVSLFHYASNESVFENTNKIFDTRLEVVLPPCKENNTILEVLAQVPITNVQAEALIDQHGSLDAAIEMNKDPTLLVKAIFPIEKERAQQLAVQATLPPEDKFPRTKLLLSALQMVDEGYPMPLRGELSGRFRSYAFTKDKYAPVTDHSPMFGVDCEMCRTSLGFNELTRISIVNEQLETVYETLVMPNNKIIDYLTPYSGITAETLMSVTKSLKEVQEEVRALLPPDAILVGQSLNSDLNAMHMMHPYVIDTSVCFNLTGMRKRKSKLQTLAMAFLQEAIQVNVEGHDSVEDSLASLKLVKKKLANSLEFGDQILCEKKRYQEILRAAKSNEIQNNLFACTTQRDKRTAIVNAGTLDRRLKDILKKAESLNSADTLKAISVHEEDCNKAAIKKARAIALENSLTVTNLQFSSDQFHLDCIERTIRNLDKWILKVWETMAHNSMFIVLMGGSTDCPSGMAKIAIKKNLASVAAVHPIAI